MDKGQTLDLEEIRKLIDLTEETGINELEVQDGDKRVKIVRSASGGLPLAVMDGRSADAPAATTDPVDPASTPPGSGTVIRTPLAGTFYRSPAPGEPAFVEVGDKVEVGDQLCIVESMKMMNNVTSDVAGRVLEILLDNGTPMESDTPIFVIAPR